MRVAAKVVQDVTYLRAIDANNNSNDYMYRNGTDYLGKLNADGIYHIVPGLHVGSLNDVLSYFQSLRAPAVQKH